MKKQVGERRQQSVRFIAPAVCVVREFRSRPILEKLGWLTHVLIYIYGFLQKR